MFLLGFLVKIICVRDVDLLYEWATVAFLSWWIQPAGRWRIKRTRRSTVPKKLARYANLETIVSSLLRRRTPGTQWSLESHFKKSSIDQLNSLIASVKKKSQSNLGRAALQLLTAENNYATKSPLITMGCSTFTPKTASSLRRSPPYLIPHLSTDPTHPTPNSMQIQSAVLPQYTPDRHTDRQFDAWDKRPVYSKSRLRLTVSDAANKAIVNSASRSPRHPLHTGLG